ncbi:hypothetical protein A2774_05390 [Candidatus Roizmanbacteria bacterium RIFCSPHIGHO2_01_FULL_39_12c]|uniref:Uncharacterized protein n=1 Tax=Candidatus Roizmanbacteria bacterium RIFCSPHIGHO2_01_FULL_39_12c TaxID=1802031 RepID=A0A1F7GE48_9BACT|nr:MAG: hypothetical protein A2774_05390 [Candidatus Roizmanbacteria bacterium RIFCSPHIGHO2_01_FULL_39_12c]
MENGEPTGNQHQKITRRDALKLAGFITGSFLAPPGIPGTVSELQRIRRISQGPPQIDNTRLSIWNKPKEAAENPPPFIVEEFSPPSPSAADTTAEEYLTYMTGRGPEDKYRIDARKNAPNCFGFVITAAYLLAKERKGESPPILRIPESQLDNFVPNDQIRNQLKEGEKSIEDMLREYFDRKFWASIFAGLDFKYLFDSKNSFTEGTIATFHYPWGGRDLAHAIVYFGAGIDSDGRLIHYWLQGYRDSIGPEIREAANQGGKGGPYRFIGPAYLDEKISGKQMGGVEGVYVSL